jgi:pimeloyl-ACP methyl ester carboxylesterase
MRTRIATPKPRLILAAAMALSMGLVPAVASASVRTARVHAAALPVPSAHPCSFSASITCGQIRVPQYWSDPGGPTFKVAYRLYPQTNAALPTEEPVVGFVGGPGASSIDSAGSWISFMGPLHASHPMLVMDYRGTGRSSPIDCQGLQHATSNDNWVDLTADCAQQLGDSANAYGLAATAADLHAILQGLGIPKVDVYGTSAGSITAASFAANYPDDIHAAVFDGAYDNTFDPFEREAAANLRAAWTKLCARAGTCAGILHSMSRFANELAAHPIAGRAHNQFGQDRRVVITPHVFADMLTDGTYSATELRDMPAAIQAARSGDTLPILRLASEMETSTYVGGGNPKHYSNGYYMAVYCHDNPLAFDLNEDYAARKASLDQQVAAMPADTFSPLSNDVYLNGLYEYQLVSGCLKWPAPAVADPAFPTGQLADIPVLVLNGEFDYATPPADAQALAARFPNGHYVELANGKHVVAQGDQLNCARAIARTFIQTLDVGDTSCATRTPDQKVVPAFPDGVARAPAAQSAGPIDQSTDLERRTAWTAAWTLGDALARQRFSGLGLRAGTYSASTPSGAPGPRINFDQTEFVSGEAISGHASYDRTQLSVKSNLQVSGPGATSGTLRIAFKTGVQNAQATIKGRLDGNRIRLVTPAPWATRV